MRALKIALVVAFVTLSVTVGGNWAVLDRRVQTALAEDSRNNGITLRAYLAWGLDPSTLVLDLRGLGTGASMADVDRVMLTALQALKDYEFSKVVLAYNSTAKFQMSGQYANQLGREYGYQNVLYTLRTIPENLHRPNGSPAFGSWTGGWLGVMGKQMEDHEKFHREWYGST